LHVNRVPEFRDTVKPNFSISEGRSWQELLWVVKTPERELDEPLTLRACVKEGPSESVLDREGCSFAPSGIRAGTSFLSVAETEIHHAA
jgi:hypothetical protein